MKHILTLLFCASALTVSAQNYKFLTFQKSSGSEKSLKADHASRMQSSLSQMGKMFFSDTATSIETVETNAEALTASIVNGQLRTNAPVGSRISVFSLDGRLLNAQAPISRGTYLVRINNTTLKVVAQ